jgi:Fe2+ transport system protein FeoA
MAQSTSPLAPEAVFNSTLLDTAGQPNLVFGSSQSNQLNWTLTNNSTKAGNDLVVTPFTSGVAKQRPYHFSFNFAPGSLTTVPSIPGWTVAVDLDSRGAIQTSHRRDAAGVYLAAETPITIAPHGNKVAELTYTTAIQEDPNNSRLAVTITAGQNVTLGGVSIEGKIFGPVDLTLVPAGAPTLSVAPISVDFVGRRTVLNDGKTRNSFTFAITNMTSADLVLTPEPMTVDGPSPSVFTVWFDASPNDPRQPWALAQVQDLDATFVQLTPPSSAWKVTNAVGEYRAFIAGNPQWALTVSNSVALAPQSPLLFTFSGIVSDLDPGFTRMYLKFQNLGSFAPGILAAELEKSPLLYGITRGQGLYLSAGTPQDNTPPAPNYSGLCVNQFGDAPAATFNGGNVGIGNTDPKNKLHIGSGESTITHDRVSVVIATKATDSGIAIAQEGGPLGPVNLLLQASGAGAYIGTTSNHPLVLRTSDADRVSIDRDGSLVANSTQIVLKTGDADRVSIDKDGTLKANATNIVLRTSDADRVSIDKDGTLKANATNIVLRTSDADRVSINKDGNVGIGTSTPGFPLSFPDTLGDKLSLYGQSGAHYGLGIQGSLLQIHTLGADGDIAFGYGKSDSLTETMRIRGNGNLSVGDGLFLLGRPDGTASLTKNAFNTPGGPWQIKDPTKKAFTVELRDSGMLELYGTVTNGQTDWRKIATFDAANN